MVKNISIFIYETKIPKAKYSRRLVWILNTTPLWGHLGTTDKYGVQSGCVAHAAQREGGFFKAPHSCENH